MYVHKYVYISDTCACTCEFKELWLVCTTSGSAPRFPLCAYMLREIKVLLLIMSLMCLNKMSCSWACNWVMEHILVLWKWWKKHSMTIWGDVRTTEADILTMQKRKGRRKNYKNHRNTYLSILYMSVCLDWEDNINLSQKRHIWGLCQ